MGGEKGRDGRGRVKGRWKRRRRWSQENEAGTKLFFVAVRPEGIVHLRVEFLEQDDAARGGEQPSQGSLADGSMHEAMEVTGAPRADAVALAEAYSQQGSSNELGVWSECRRGDRSALGMDLGLEAVQVKAQERLSAEKPFEADVLGFLPVAGTQCKARQNGRAAEAWQASLGICLRVGTAAGQARCTRSLRTPVGSDIMERVVLEGVVGDGWHRQGSM